MVSIPRENWWKSTTTQTAVISVDDALGARSLHFEALAVLCPVCQQEAVVPARAFIRPGGHAPKMEIDWIRHFETHTDEQWKAGFFFWKDRPYAADLNSRFLKEGLL